MWLPFRRRTKCPVDRELERWVEARFAWLVAQFGLEALRRTPAVRPDEAFFPDRFDGTERTARSLFDRVCQYMGVPPQRVLLRLYEEGRQLDLAPGIIVTSDEGGTAGYYEAAEQETVWLETSVLNHPMSCIATMAHELAHVKLLGSRALTAAEEDHEPLTDLATVYFGMGIFNANSVIVDEQWTSAGGWSGWSMGRAGYLDEATFGYALALFAWLRGENKPAWFRDLRPGVRTVSRQGLRYLIRNDGPTVEALHHVG